ncbi:cation-translocating P-type ATPase [Dongia sp.]|uniref:cation-translocating P-type ATPase n=1 Tax=Dongia sp. TaxID=1977262 RepID=UPI0035AF1FF8
MSQPARLGTKDHPHHISHWHMDEGAAIAQHLHSDIKNGLSAAEAAARLAKYGPNILPEGKRRRWFLILAEQFKDVMVLLLVVAAAIAAFIGEPQDTIVILVILLLNAGIGFVQQMRSERAMAALRHLALSQALVRREGSVRNVPSADLVSGDLVLLEAGNLVPADLRLIESVDLAIAEATLTGESLPVEKAIAPLADADIALGDRTNMAYRGTLVTRGRGLGLVVATGARTEIGRIAHALAKAVERQTPLEARLADLVRRLALGVLAVCAIFFALGLLRGEPVMTMLLTAVSLAVAAVPEALPAVVTIALAFGAVRMVQQQVLVRRLSAVEALGSVTFICADKTGTLTRNEMLVERLWLDGATHPDMKDSRWRLLHEAMCLNNDASAAGADRTTWLGDPTETALLAGAMAGGIDLAICREGAPRVDEAPFTSERRRMTTLHSAADGALRGFMKGAPEALLDLCRAQCGAAGATPLDRHKIEAAVADMAAEGYRVLAFATATFDVAPDDLSASEAHFAFLGLVGMMDPPRAGVAEAIAECRHAGIHPVMITGDHPVTAAAVARRLGLLAANGAVLSGPELAALSTHELQARVRDIAVYARVDPAQKTAIVAALQAQGEIAAMTGDGVNDAPALKRADIGIAMGKLGTDVAREAADLVLLDDAFPSIVAAVREGRRIYDNIRKFLRYILTTNMGELWTLFLAPLLGLPLPLLPIHILWINLATDSLPSLALAVDKAEPDIMHRKPRAPRESLFAGGLWLHAFWVGLLMAGLALAAQTLSLEKPAAYMHGMVFATLTFAQIGHVMAIHTARSSALGRGFWSNRWLLLAVVPIPLLLLAALYTPLGNAILRVTPLDGADLGLTALAGIVIFAAVEIEKAIRHRK